MPSFIVQLVMVLFFWRQCGTNTAVPVTYHFFFTSDFVFLASFVLADTILVIEPDKAIESYTDQNFVYYK